MFPVFFPNFLECALTSPHNITEPPQQAVKHSHYAPPQITLCLCYFSLLLNHVQLEQIHIFALLFRLTLAPLAPAAIRLYNIHTLKCTQPLQHKHIITNYKLQLSIVAKQIQIQIKIQMQIQYTLKRSDFTHHLYHHPRLRSTIKWRFALQSCHAAAAVIAAAAAAAAVIAAPRSSLQFYSMLHPTQHQSIRSSVPAKQCKIHVIFISGF